MSTHPPHTQLPTLEDALQSQLGPAFRITRELPGAGMSRVFVARDIALDRDVAVKVLPPDLHSSSSVARFRVEIEVTTRLQHPHILPVISAGGDERLRWYVMPYVAGGSLRAQINSRQLLPFAHATRVVSELLAAIALAHDRGVVHRDIKPANVLLSEGHAILADFGIARVMDEMHDDAHVHASVAAPEGYLAPERPVNEAADLYAVAVLAHETLTHAIPAAGDSATAISDRISRAHPDTGDELARAIGLTLARALARDPARRFRSAHAFRDAVTAPVTEAPHERLTLEALVHLERGDSQAALEVLRRMVASQPLLPLAWFR